MRGAIVAGRDLHIVGGSENSGDFIGDQIVSCIQSDASQIRLGDGTGRVGDIREQSNQRTVGKRVLDIDEGGKDIVWNFSSGPGGA